MPTPCRPIVLALLVLSPACAPRDPENSAVCGFAFIAGSSMVVQYLNNQHAMLQAVPPGLTGTLGARVVGHGSGKAVVTAGKDGVQAGFEGEGFPTKPGYGLVLVDDSSETVRGILILDQEVSGTPPVQLGTLTHGENSAPLYGVRVNWGSVSDPKCPLIRQPRAG